MPRYDLTGKVFTRLVVVGFSHKRPDRHSCWECLCSCGKSVVVAGNCLKRGSTKSCGCLKASPRKRLFIDDLTGRCFGRLSVVGFSHSGKNGRAFWRCSCSCGSVVSVSGTSLKTGGTVSCGCSSTKHGKAGTPIYGVWNSMIQRCTNSKRDRYKNYGGRGIVVCEEWLSFENFYKDMGDKPSSDHTLDRIDVNGSYCRENCRWATSEEQNNNKRTSRFVAFDGQVRTIKQWSEALGISYNTLRSRLDSGWEIERALTQPSKRNT